MPKFSYKLNSIDRLMLNFDQVFRKQGKRGNVCAIRLTLKLEEAAAIKTLIENDPCISELWNLRLKGNFFLGYAWQAGCDRRISVDVAKQGEDVPFDKLVGSVDLDPHKDSPPLRFKILETSRQCELLFFWHHSFMDAHGAESLLYELLKFKKIDLNNLSEAAQNSSSGIKTLVDRFRSATNLKKHIFKLARQRISYFNKGRAGAADLVYRHIFFSKEETSKIDSNCERYGVGLYKSAYYLHSISGAFKNMLFRNGQEADDFFVPIPRDLRKRNSKRQTLGNHLSPMFLKVRSVDLENTDSSLESILAGILENISSNLHRKSQEFFSLLQRLPDSAYSKILGAPTKGRHASFYFSDTGDSLSKFDALESFEILGLRHYPPHFFPPGLSFVFSRKSAMLCVAIVSDESLGNQADFDFLEQKIRSHLLA